MNLPEQVLLREVGPRDGLQNVSKYVDPQNKVRLVEMLVTAGLHDIEVTSFVHPKAVPQMRDAEVVLGLLPQIPEVEFSMVALNFKGAQRGIDAGAKTLVLNVSASESYSRHNVQCSREEALLDLENIASLCKQNHVAVRADISSVFGCPFDGAISVNETAYVVKRMIQAGIKEICLADTAGLGNPRQVYRICSELRQEFPEVVFGLHLHETRGMGLVNLLAGIQTGIHIVETSVGGLGGSPFIPKAAGNVATEDVVYMLQEMNIKTGIDLDKVLEAAKFLEGILERPLMSRQLEFLNMH